MIARIARTDYVTCPNHKSEELHHGTFAMVLKHLRSVGVGDTVLYSHTGEETAIVGVTEVVQTEVSASNR